MVGPKAINCKWCGTRYLEVLAHCPECGADTTATFEELLDYWREELEPEEEIDWQDFEQGMF